MGETRSSKIISAYCSYSGDLDLFKKMLSGLNTVEREIIQSVLSQLQATRLIRVLSRTRTTFDRVPNDLLRLEDGVALLGFEPIGQIVQLYKSSQPFEAQAKIAYDVFFDRAFDFLAAKHKIIVLTHSKYTVEIFVPGNRPFDMESLWEEISDYVFGLDNLRQTFMALMNSIKLADRGVSALTVPIVNSEHALVLAAFNLKNLLSLQDGDKKREREIAETDKKLATEPEPTKIHQLEASRTKIIDELDTRRERYEPFYNEWDALRTELPGWSKKVYQIARNEYSPRAGTQIAKVGTKIGKAVSQIPVLAIQSSFFKLPMLLTDSPVPEAYRIAGDSGGHFCYSCGRNLPKKEGSYKASSLIFSSASQRLQSGGSQTEPKVCATCAALSFVSPIKLGEGRLILRLHRVGHANEYLVDDQLRMFTLGELNLVAGRYTLLIATESVGKNLLIDQLGGAQYAIYKVASLFASEVFEQYQPEIMLGESDIELQRRHVACMHHLIEVFGLKRTTWKDKSQFAAFGRSIRHIQKDQIIFAIYELLKSGIVNINPIRAKQLEQLRSEQIRWLEMDKENEKAQFYKDVAGMTGLLYAFCNYVNSQVTDANKKRIEVRKLIERTTDPNQFIYTAAGNTEQERATLFRNDDMHFCYDESKELLKWLGIDSQERESQSDKGQLQLTFYFDDVVQVYTKFLSPEKYAKPKEWREFTYALKLSLHARFPQYISNSKENK